MFNEILNKFGKFNAILNKFEKDSKIHVKPNDLKTQLKQHFGLCPEVQKVQETTNKAQKVQETTNEKAIESITLRIIAYSYSDSANAQEFVREINDNLNSNIQESSEEGEKLSTMFDAINQKFAGNEIKPDDLQTALKEPGFFESIKEGLQVFVNIVTKFLAEKGIISEECYKEAADNKQIRKSFVDFVQARQDANPEQQPL